MKLNFVIPMKPIGKARPRVTSRGTFMPKNYDLWRGQFRLHVRNNTPNCFLHLLPIAGRLNFYCSFFSPSGEIRPDLDNAIGAILDAIQVPKKGGLGLIQDDKQFVLIVARIVKGPTKICFEIEGE